MWAYKAMDGTVLCECRDKEEMTEYLRDNCTTVDDVDFERWLDEEYRASQIVWMFRDGMFRDGTFCTASRREEAIIMDLWDECEEAWIDEAGDPVEGEDFDFNGYVFEWMEE